MNSRKIFCFTLLFLFLLTVPFTSWAAGRTFKFTLLYGDPKTELSAAVLTNEAEGWIPRLERESNGKIKISKVFYAGQLIADPEIFDAIVRGTADIAINTSAFTPGRFPTLDLISVIPLGRGSRCIHPSAAAMDVWKKYPKEIEMGFEGTKLLELAAPIPNPPGMFIGSVKKPIRTLEDFKGLKMTGPGKYNMDLLKAFGASPVMIPPFEQYTALQKGIIEANILDPLFYDMVSLKEIIHYQTNINFGGNAFYVVMNQKKWDSTPKDIQDVFMRISGKFGERADTFGKAKKEEVLKNTIRDYGLQVIDISKEELAKMQAIERPLLEKHIASFEAQGLPAKEIYNAWVDARAKYSN